MSGMPALPYRHISNQQQLDELGFSVRFSWSDGAGHSFRERDADDTTGCQELEGFLPCEMDVRLEVEVAIEHPRKIFGNFAAKDAELGLALQYQFKKLGNQGAMPFENCVITDQDKSVNKRFTHVFPKSTFRDISGFTVLLYVKNPGKGDVRFAQNAGAIIGRIDGRAIITGGSGYIFSPYKVSSGKKEPLWWVVSTISADTLDNDLDAEFKVYVNTDNPSYPSLCLDSAFFSPLKLEMFATVCTQLIDAVRSAGDVTWDLEGDCEGDSVLSHVRYFLKRFLPDRLEGYIKTAPLYVLANIIRTQLFIAAEKKLVVEEAK